jgi:hypothetical protein
MKFVYLKIPLYYAIINGKKVYDVDSIRDEFDRLLKLEIYYDKVKK